MAETAETIESGQDPVRGEASNGAGYAEEAAEAEGVQESANVSQPSFLDALFTPEGIVMFALAVIVDVAEIALDLTGVGAVVALALDIAAYIIIGGWMMARSSDVKVSERAAETLKKATKQQFEAASVKWQKRLKWARITVPMFELIPFISIVPCWIIAVYFELKYGKMEQ